MPDETQDPKPHVHVHADANAPVAIPAAPGRGQALSIWFFCGILTLGYGLVLMVQGYLDLAHPPSTVLANLHPTLWWGVLLTLFGGFYTIRFRPGKG